MTASSPLAMRAVLQTQRATVISCTALIALGLAWELWLAPTGRGTLAVKVLPLALALPGLARQHLRTYRWASLLVWLYAGEGALRAASEAGRPALLAVLQLALSLALFVACVLHIRRRLALPVAA